MPFLSTIWAKLAAAAAILLAVAGFLAKIFNMGRRAERGDNAIKGLQAERERVQVDADVAAGGDAERRKLRDAYRRD